MVQKTLANSLKFMGEMACAEMDITMKNFYLDLFQRLNVVEFTRYVTFEKGREFKQVCLFMNVD